MLEVVLSNRFKKDLKLAARRGLPLDELNTVVDWLAAGQALPDRNRDHALTGDYIGFRECHIRPGSPIRIFRSNFMRRITCIGL